MSSRKEFVLLAKQEGANIPSPSESVLIFRGIAYATKPIYTDSTSKNEMPSDLLWLWIVTYFLITLLLFIAWMLPRQILGTFKKTSANYWQNTQNKYIQINALKYILIPA